jgi:hypothetical protein
LLFGDLDAAGAGRGGALLVLVMVAAVGACVSGAGFCCGTAITVRHASARGQTSMAQRGISSSRSRNPAGSPDHRSSTADRSVHTCVLTSHVLSVHTKWFQELFGRLTRACPGIPDRKQVADVAQP